MKLYFIFVFLAVLLSSCSYFSSSTDFSDVYSIQELYLTQEDLSFLGLEQIDVCNYIRSDFGDGNEYALCNYTTLDNQTEVFIQLERLENFSQANNSYQYQSLHLRGYQGLIEEDTYGDLSRFYVTQEDDVLYYHLWIVVDRFILHITTNGVVEVELLLRAVGRRLLV